MKKNTRVIWKDDRRQLTVTGFVTPSVNRKTGDMLQAMISPVDVSPIDGIATGTSHNGCDTCPVRKACYVNPRMPQAVWKASRGQSPVNFLDAVQDARTAAAETPIRLGSWGDIATVPVDVTETLLTTTTGKRRAWTGYTHLWSSPSVEQDYRQLLMASVESSDGRQQAKEKGFRTFRILHDGAKLETGEVLCPYYTSNGTVKCRTCRLCDGARPNDKRKDIAVHVHGSRKGNLS